MTKKDLIILHGALGSAGQMKDALGNSFQEHFNCHYLNFIGHATEQTTERFSIALFAQQVKDYVSDHQLNRPFVFGYSMGGYVALALESEERTFSAIVTLGTKFEWTPEVAHKEAGRLNPELMEEKIPQYTEILKVRYGQSNWKEVVKHTADLMVFLGENQVLKNLKEVTCPVVVCRAEHDQMVHRDESLYLATEVDNGKYFEIQGSKHPVEQTDLSAILELMTNLISKCQ